MIKRIIEFIKSNEDRLMGLIIYFFIISYKEYNLYKISAFVPFMFSCILIYSLQSPWIKNIFNDSTPREFLSMGDHSKKGDTPYFGGLVFFLALFPLFFFFLKKIKNLFIFF